MALEINRMSLLQQSVFFHLKTLFHYSFQNKTWNIDNCDYFNLCIFMLILYICVFWCYLSCHIAVKTRWNRTLQNHLILITTIFFLTLIVLFCECALFNVNLLIRKADVHHMNVMTRPNLCQGHTPLYFLRITHWTYILI